MVGGWEEKWRLMLTSAKVEVEVEAELDNNNHRVKSTDYKVHNIEYRVQRTED